MTGVRINDKKEVLKYIFCISSALLLFLMILLSRNAGISCDEVLHYNHSLSVYNFFATHGQDQSALNTPETHLKYYGQSFDNIVTFLTEWFSIDDIYGFRHLMSSLAGWLAIFVTALFAVWLSGYRTGILVLILFSVSPTFMGHAQNNLKDIPFALAYIAAIFYMLKFLFQDITSRSSDVLLLIMSIGFSLSIRAGGLILICYLVFFYLIFLLYHRVKAGKPDITGEGKRLVIIILVSLSAWCLGIILWPFALQHPVSNVLESYRTMLHFPSTFRQTFEGRMEWSDFMPWYYLPKSMAITIPLLVTAGLLAFLFYSRKIYKSGKSLLYGMILFTVLFPVFFAVIKKSNLYSSWRQFLFLYPVIVLVSATGYSLLFESLKKKYFRWLLVAITVLMAVHPLKFMFKNPSCFYLYYNQLVGGLKGAYGNYETDYYYTGQTEASRWLIKYLEEKNTDSAVVGATFSVQWQFRKHPGIRTFYLRNDERSQYDWDYAIITSRYIPVSKLKNKTWPPGNAIHIVYADNVPICAVLERKTKADYYGYKSLEESRAKEAVIYFNEALRTDDKDEMIFYNFARALNYEGESVRADSVLTKGLEINPDFEPILMYMGNLAKERDDTLTAGRFYNRVLKVNRKNFDAYLELAGIMGRKDYMKARNLLRTCLTMDPGFKPAIKALADTYRKTDPDIAEKYDKLIETIK